ncbi:MAG TPA: hypothetical protein VKB35_08155 [Ktedonobacteraceae bacterium]|nr:hypothetical protein [Ktedonobacteraceae bacterium]
MYESTNQRADLSRNVVGRHRRASFLLLAASVLAAVTVWSLAVVLPASGYQAMLETHSTVSSDDRADIAAAQPHLLPATATAPALATDTPSARATDTPSARATATPQPTTTRRATVTPQPTATPQSTATAQPTATAVATPTPAASGRTSGVGAVAILAIFGILLLIALIVMVAILLTRRSQQPPTGGPGAGYPEQQRPSEVVPPPYPPVTSPLEQEQHTYWRQTEWRQVQQESQGQFPTGSPGQIGSHPSPSQPIPPEYEAGERPPASPDKDIPDSPSSTSPGGDPGRDPSQ